MISKKRILLFTIFSIVICTFLFYWRILFFSGIDKNYFKPGLSIFFKQFMATVQYVHNFIENAESAKYNSCDKNVPERLNLQIRPESSVNPHTVILPN